MNKNERTRKKKDKGDKLILKLIKTKTVILLISSMMLAIIIVGGLSIITATGNIRNSSTQNLTLVCENNKLKINARIQSIEQSVKFLSQSSIALLKDFNEFCTNPQYVDDYTEKLTFMSETLASNTDGCLSVYIRYNPKYTEPTSGLFIVYNKEHDQFEQNEPTDLGIYAEDDVEHVGWYYVPVKKQKAMWMPPYYNANLDRLIVSYVIPIYRNGVNVGVIGMDLDFDFFRNLIEDIQAYSSGYAFLLDENGNVMVHKELPLYTQLVEKDEKLIDLIRPIKEDTNSTGQYMYQKVKKNYASAQLNNDMVLCISAPTSEIYKASRELIVKIVMIGVVAFILLTIIAYHVINHIMKLANVDELTGLANRKVFLESYASVKNMPQNNYSMFIFDIDHFKEINDKLGHNCGDIALRDLAEVTRSELGKDTMIARWGGDEFIGLLPVDCAYGKLEHLREYVAHNMKGEYGRISISIGIAKVDKNMTVREMTEKTDKALYMSKSRGRNRITIA